MAANKNRIQVLDPGTSDVLSQLLECSFRGVSFPVETLETDVSHDVIQHKRMDRDGAKLENTGLGAFTYVIKAPFCNTIARGPMESWNNLYPDQKNKMLDALSDRSTGDFMHPELGLRRCKCTTFKQALDPAYRGGVVLNFTLVEDTEDDDAIAITQNSVLAIATQAAIDLDAAIGQLIPSPGNVLAEDGFKSFENFMNSITGIFDQIGLLKKQILGKIDRVIGKINKLVDTVSDTIHDLGTAPDDLIHSLLQIKHNALLEPKPLGYFQTKGATTLGQISMQFGNTIQQLVTLNPDLASSPTVPAFTIVRYYK